MSNIRKSFNFRDGVQVDNDIFVVRGPLVGIGTSVPTEKLDVRGTVSVSGLVTSRSFLTNNLYVTGVSTYTNELFVGITSINSGIITASSDSGIVTYYGDGGRLLNLPTSQWLDVDVGLGFTSIYAQGFVGIATFDPRFVLQIGGNARTEVGEFRRGVGISSAGDILATGFATAYSFVGYGTGITNLDANQITDGTLNNGRLPETISIKDFIGLGITVSDSASIGSVYITSGLVTSTSGIITYYGDGSNLTDLNADELVSGTLDNERLPSDISVSGIITATGGFIGNLVGNVAGDLVGNVTGIASTARSLIGSPDIIVGIITASGNISVGGSVGVDKFLAVKEGIISHGTLTTGIATVSEFFNVGTGATISSSGVIGIGTLTPLSDFELKKETNATISVVSDSGQARIAVGQESGIGDASAVFRFGNQDRTLDIINYDYGNYNYYLHSGSEIGINTGSFNWLYGKTNDILATLTYDGKFGIGVTNPQNNLEVVGTSTVTGDLYVGSSIYVEDGIIFSNGLVLGSSSGNSTVLNDVNLNTTSGITTLSQLNILGVGLLGIGTNQPSVGLDASNVNGLVNNLGIGTLNPNNLVEDLTVFGTSAFTSTVGIGTNKVFLSQSEQEEIGTLQIFGQARIYNNALIFAGDIGGIGIGTELPDAAIDLSRAKGFLGERVTFLPPVLTNTERNAMSFVPEGGLIYNRSSGSIQVYNGSTWTVLSSNTNISGTNGTITNLSGTNLNYVGISTLTHVRSVTLNNSGVGTISVFNSTNAVISGVITANQFRRSGGTSSQFLKADGSVDSNTYLTSYTETDTLNSVLSRGNTSTRDISVGVLTATNGNFTGNLTVLGTLTYEDVVNVDSIGIATARSGLRILAGGLEVSGVSTLTGITTITGQTLFAKQTDVSGISTASSFVKRGGTSSQFLKADGSIDSTAYASQVYVGLSTSGLASVSYVDTQVGLSTAGLISSTGDGSGLTNIVTSITAGSGISVDQSTGNVTISVTGGGGGGESYWESTSVGINTLSNVGIGTTNPTEKLDVLGTVKATAFVGDGSGLTGIVATGSGIVIEDGGSPVGTAATINFGDNLSVNLSGGIATIDSIGGGESYWAQSVTGIHTLSKVAIGTDTATETLTVRGDARVTGILTVGSSSITLNGITDTIEVQNVESSRLSVNNVNVTGVITSTSFSTGSNGLTITQNDIFSNGTVTINSPFRVVGNFFVDGQQTVINTSQLQVTDKVINLGNVESGSPSDITADGGGIVLRGTSDKLFLWSNFTNSWSSNVNINIGSDDAYKINNEDRLTYSQLTVPNANVTGVITATQYNGNGSSLTGIVTSIVAGSNINISASSGTVVISAAAISGGGDGGATGINVYDNQGFIGFASAIDFGNNLVVSSLDSVSGFVTVTASASGGESLWGSTSVGIHTLSRVGIGTTNPTSAFTVSGNSVFTGIVTATSFVGTVNASTLNVSGVATISQGRIQANASANLRFGNGPAGSGSSRNIAIGDQVLASLTGGQGRNIGIGELSYFDTTTGQYNVGIGERAGQKVSTGSYNVILGAYDGNSGGLDIRTSSRNVVIADGEGNIRQYINSSGNVGIKTTVVTEALTVAGIVSATSFYGTLNAGQLTGALPAIDGSALIGVVGSGSGVIIEEDGTPVGTAGTINFGSNLDVSFVGGVATVSGNGLATYANVAGITTYATTAGVSTISGTATYAITAGISTTSGTSGYATTAGISSAVSGTININTTGIITASSFSGSGANLTNLPAGQLTGTLPAIDGSALLNVTASGTGIVVEDDQVNVGSATTINFGTGLDVSFSAGIATITASGGSLQSRTTVSGVTTSIANNALGNINITGFKSYALMRVGLSTAGWLRLYTDSASRDADVLRSQGEDPAPGSGVIAEVVTTGISTTQIISPFVMGGNLDNPADTTIYASIKNLSGTTQAITANLTILQLEA